MSVYFIHSPPTDIQLPSVFFQLPSSNWQIPESNGLAVGKMPCTNQDDASPPHCDLWRPAFSCPFPPLLSSPSLSLFLSLSLSLPLFTLISQPFVIDIYPQAPALEQDLELNHSGD